VALLVLATTLLFLMIQLGVLHLLLPEHAMPGPAGRAAGAADAGRPAGA
jgi:hypothetical protein